MGTPKRTMSKEKNKANNSTEMKASKGRETKIYLLIVGMKATPLLPHSATRVLDL